MALNLNALTTLARIKSQLSIANSDTTQDSLLEFYINSASQKIATYCDRVFQSATYTEYFHGRRQNMIMPKQWPITSVTELRIDSERDWVSADSLIDPTDYFLSDYDNVINYTSVFPQGYGNVRLIYVAGYATIPSDLEMACVWLTEWYYHHRKRQDMGRTSISKGDESIGVLSQMPAMIQELLIDYKRSEFAALYSPVANL